MNTTTSTDCTGLVLAFHTNRDADRSAHLHDEGCSVVRSGHRTLNIVREHVAVYVKDLEERGYPVKWCKCCKA